MRQQPCRTIPAAARRGFTLLEMVVTLVLLGLAAAIVAPVLMVEQEDGRSEGDAAIARAREHAVRRAQTLDIVFDGAGSWTLSPVGETGVIASGHGHVGESGSMFRLRISPLGVCLREAGRAPGDWDALACSRSNGVTGR